MIDFAFYSPLLLDTQIIRNPDKAFKMAALIEVLHV